MPLTSRFMLKGDGVTDDWEALTAAITYCSEHNVPLTLPNGTKFFKSKVLDVPGNLRLSGYALGSPSHFSCEISSPPDVGGIRATYVPQGGMIEPGTNPTLAIEGIEFTTARSAGAGAGPLAHGIEASIHVSLDKVQCAGFTGNGFHLTGYNDAIHGNPGFTSLGFLKECTAYQCGGNGFYSVGNDSNAIMFLQCSGILNGQYGFRDDSFLGDYFIGCHAATNGKAPTAQGTIYSGFVWQVNPSLAQVELTGSFAPGFGWAGTPNTPGSQYLPNLWLPVEPTTAKDTYVPGQIYLPGGAYALTNPSNYGVLLGCYGEGDQPGSFIQSSRTVVLGGIHAEGFVGSIAPLWHPHGGTKCQAMPGSNTTLWGAASTEVVTTIHGAGQDQQGTVESIQGSVTAPGVWTKRLDSPTGNLIFGYGDSISFAAAGPRSAMPLGLMAFPSLGLGKAASPPIVTTGTEAPSGAATQGSICFNSAPAPGGQAGWICTTGGDEAEGEAIWKPFGTIGS